LQKEILFSIFSELQKAKGFYSLARYKCLGCATPTHHAGKIAYPGKTEIIPMSPMAAVAGFLPEETVREIDQVHLVRRPGQGCIEPSQVINCRLNIP
jgi:hypothetical protein